MLSPHDTRLPETFRARIQVNLETGCWEWTAHLNQDGYGYFYWNSKGTYAHRAAYTILAGPIPKHLTIDHLCRVRHCANPEHLEVVTHRVNTLRGNGPAAVNARKTQCLQGHTYNPKNTWYDKYGYRTCRVCKQAGQRRRRASARGAIETARVALKDEVKE